MAGSVNKVILVGNLGRDPEVRRLEFGRSGRQPAHRHFRILEGQEFGERKEKTEWHSVVIFNENLAKVAEQYLKKGSKVYIEGQLQTRKWQDQSGQRPVYDRGGSGEIPRRVADARCARWRRRPPGRLLRRAELARRLDFGYSGSRRGSAAPAAAPCATRRRRPLVARHG